MSKEKERKHSAAFQSPLWPHLEQIRTWRRGRMTWKDITKRLNEEPYSVGLTLQAVHSFFATASKRQTPPLGFDSLPGQPAPAQMTEPTDREVDSKKERPIYEPEPENDKNLFPK